MRRSSSSALPPPHTISLEKVDLASERAGTVAHNLNGHWRYSNAAAYGKL